MTGQLLQEEGCLNVAQDLQRMQMGNMAKDHVGCIVRQKCTAMGGWEKCERSQDASARRATEAQRTK